MSFLSFEENNSQIKPFLKSKNLILPIDVIAVKGNTRRDVKPNEVNAEENILDIGKDSVALLGGLIEKAAFILLNGPLGKYEIGFGGATESVLKLIAKSKANSIVGGGDTVSLITKLKLGSQIGFVSTGGGATLDFLAKGTLAGIKALK